ncbi:uncharacterized protein BJ212DRAFT_1299347 [Suillus subaureus]|uniref:Uncharacterized protein n=1 Tax=Suillus subaureus TaxID=48587 RepID=A0A9P7EC75_9AGAM|nr:uncharacterized protein BJ212DRAFT_1299347 [Suillus subaureus]KAG1817187.1 hypothetical protein BJ212DRAFT_1299347 [Suillus subaureus]
MSPQSAIRFNDPLVTDYNSMDVDESTVSRASLDDLYLGPDDDIEYDSPSSGSLDVLAAIPNLYLGPEDDIINVDELPDSANPKIDVPAASEASMSWDYRYLLSSDHLGHMNTPGIDLVITNTVLGIFLILPFHCYLRPSDPSGWLGQKLPTNSEELMQTSRGCKEPNG